ncbi:MAG: C-GCAxxG-C-C family protein [Nitrospiraceae bacterium]|nr:C-GCAxxG-C-C family protein [Nitrospiraceae bacterium]
METEKLLDEKLSRRNLLISGGKAAAGAAILSVAGLKAAKTADAYEFASAYKYAKLDTKEVGQITYENYFNRWCTSSVVAGLVESLKKKAGGAWKDFPIDAYRWGHGGLAGWGALCGTMPGAGVVIGLVTKDTDTAEAMVNDLAFYYAYTELPDFTPAKVLGADIKHMTVAGTPVCHISVGKWMRAEGVAFLAKERAERCARLSADVAMEAARMLNVWSEGSYKPKHKPLYNVLANGITSQNNCRDCHGEYTPSPSKTYDTLNK